MTDLSYFDNFCKLYQPYKRGSWCYEDGCIYRGLTLLHQVTEEPRWLDHLLRLTTPQIGPDGKLTGYSPKEYNIDHILAGRCLFYLGQITGDPRYLGAAGQLATQLDHHPRISTGNYWHKKVYPDQVWLDGLYMSLPFQIELGLATDTPARITDVIAQLQSALALTRKTRLFAHGYDEARRQDWADPATGQSPAVWARAIGWLAMALVDSYDLTRDVTLGRATADLLTEVVAEQSPTGLWPQVMDAPDLAGNYDETSASAMLSYALLAAGRLGIGNFAAPGRRGFAAILSDRLTNDADGTQHLTQIVHVAGLGKWSGGPYRDGSPAYYLTEAIVSDDAKGVGPLMMAAAEMRR